ncbi:MAG: SsrA-binding protein SmpB [Bacilli bacterium]|nr:SsrA-binding protein SmpB [Bacilli bacterium]
MGKKEKSSALLLENRKARFEYFLSDFIVAGLVLTGTEIKSLRRHDAGISDAYIYIKNREAFVANMHIAPYKEGNIFNVDHLRDRKLLLNKREIDKLDKKLKEGGVTCVPTKLFLQRGYAKLEIALAKGKKNYDKRQTIKERDLAKKVKEAKNEFNS